MIVYGRLDSFFMRDESLNGDSPVSVEVDGVVREIVGFRVEPARSEDQEASLVLVVKANR